MGNFMRFQYGNMAAARGAVDAAPDEINAPVSGGMSEDRAAQTGVSVAASGHSMVWLGMVMLLVLIRFVQEKFQK